MLYIFNGTDSLQVGGVVRKKMLCENKQNSSESSPMWQGYFKLYISYLYRNAAKTNYAQFKIMHRFLYHKHHYHLYPKEYKDGYAPYVTKAPFGIFTDCIKCYFSWSIICRKEFKIVLTVAKLNLRSSIWGDCLHQYLMFDDNVKPKGVFCGRHEPFDVISSKNNVTVVLFIQSRQYPLGDFHAWYQIHDSGLDSYPVV